MRQFETSAEALKELYNAKKELRMARGFRKRDLTKYVNRLARVYENLRKEERDNAKKKADKAEDH